MNYNSAFFLCALPIIFTLYYLITPMVSSEMRTKTGNTLLIIVSYVVLAYENTLSCILLAYVTIVTFLGGKVRIFYK